ncbi:MAG TPA: hypothetical protein VFH97_01780 [Gemmatimonadales bacterium]|nr:hypothetical protein [Gemmatimonadales bacterium]
MTLGALVAAALLAAPLSAQHPMHGARPDSAARHDCAMGSMQGGTMQGGMMRGGMMRGGMGGTDSAGMAGMMSDSTMMADMRFAPHVVLARRELLGLTPDQVSRIEALTRSTPDSGAAHMARIHDAAAEVRKILTAEQRAQVERLPRPCPSAWRAG